MQGRVLQRGRRHFFRRPRSRPQLQPLAPAAMASGVSGSDSGTPCGLDRSFLNGYIPTVPSKFNLQKPLKYEFFNVSLILVGLSIVGYLVFRIANLQPLYFVLWDGTLPNVHIWSLLTYDYVIISEWSLLGVGVVYFFIGTQLERSLGSWEFLMYYLFVTIFSGLLSAILLATTGVGGAVFGPDVALFSMIFGFAAMYPRSVLHLFFILPVPSWLLVLGYIAIYVVIGIVSGVSMNEVAIIFAFVFALIYFLVRLGNNPFREWFRR